MYFTLYYHGILKSKGKPKDKHRLREQFNPQLKALWSQDPLLNFRSFYQCDDINNSIARKIKGFTFVPLICKSLSIVARMHITILRPESPGSIIVQGGDIDNRLKTLLDSLKIPSEPNDLPPNVLPEPSEPFFFCLLDDDNLITDLSVSTKRLFIPSLKIGEVITILDIETVKIGTLMGGMELP